jgi:hypothetical protein
MSAQDLEAFPARLLVDRVARERFLVDPATEAARADLSESERTALRALDRVGLELAARSVRGKRRRAT